MSSYHLSSKADDDIDDIVDYTLETWGESQTDLLPLNRKSGFHSGNRFYQIMNFNLTILNPNNSQ